MLLMVVVVITIAALSGTTAMYLADAEMGAAGTSLKMLQARALAWSGVQAAMAELADQREKLLDGQAPSLTQEWELYTDDGGGRGVVRLAVVGSGDEKGAVSESAKLDLNSATAEMLAKLPGVDATLAQAIVGARGSGTFASVEDLLRVQGVAPEMLHGGEANGEAGDASGSARSGGLADLVTVFSFDPNVQSGLGEGGADHRGSLRLNLSTGWSEGLGQAVDQRFGTGTGAALKDLIEKGQKFASMADVVSAARTAGIQPKDWAGLLDAFSVTDDPYLVGRIDVNRAGSAALAAVPGITPELAQQVVDARAKVDDESKRSPAWLVTQGVLTGEQFQQAVDHLTTRSMQWRVRVEAGTAARDETGQGERLSETPLATRVVLEAVIDVASERPRVAYLRDVTLLETARALKAELALEGPESEGEESTPPLASAAAGPVGATGTSGAPGATGRSGATGEVHADLDLSSGMDQGFGDLDLGGDMDLGTDLNLGTSAATGPIQGDAGGSGPVGPPAPGDAGAPGGGSSAQDRRVGRWTTGKSKGAGQ